MMLPLFAFFVLCSVGIWSPASASAIDKARDLKPVAAGSYTAVGGKPQPSTNIADGFGVEDATFAVQTATQGGMLTQMRDGRDAHDVRYELVLNGVTNLTAVTNLQSTSHDAMKNVHSSLIGNQLPRFAMLWVNQLSGTDIESYAGEDMPMDVLIRKSTLVPLTLLEVLSYDEASSCIRYAVELKENALLAENNGTRREISALVDVERPFEFTIGSLMIDFQELTGDPIGDNEVNQTSIRHVSDTGEIADVFMKNVRASTHPQVKAQGLATLWVPIYGIGRALFCCPAVPIITCLGACWFNPLFSVTLACCLI